MHWCKMILQTEVTVHRLGLQSLPALHVLQTYLAKLHCCATDGTLTSRAIGTLIVGHSYYCTSNTGRRPTSRVFSRGVVGHSWRSADRQTTTRCGSHPDTYCSHITQTLELHKSYASMQVRKHSSCKTFLLQSCSH